MRHCTLTCWCTLYYVGFITLSLLHIRLVTRQYGAIWWYSWSAATGLQSITCPDGWSCGVSVMESQSPRPCVMRPVWLDATSPKGRCGKMWFRYKPLGLVSWCWCARIASNDRGLHDAVRWGCGDLQGWLCSYMTNTGESRNANASHVWWMAESVVVVLYLDMIKRSCDLVVSIIRSNVSCQASYQIGRVVMRS